MKTISPRIKSLIDCDRVLHNWARLLARVGEICVPAKPDHSHMSFTWNPEIRGLVGQSFISNKGHVSLALSIREPICFYFMGSKENQRLIEIDIAGNHYAIVMDFLDLALRDLGYRKANVSRKVSFKFPDQFKSDGTSPPISNEILQLWQLLRTSAGKSCQSLLNHVNQESAILIWPTNFDTGIFCEYDLGVTQFAGFAPADEEVCSSPYYYNSFYKNDEKIIPSDFPELKHGHWETEKWAGAVFPLYPGVNIEEFNLNSQRFLLDTTDIFLNRILPKDEF